MISKLIILLLLSSTAFAGQQIVGNLSVSGNVGIGTISNTSIVLPLDINGTARMTGFQLSTNPSSGYVLTSNGVGIGTWAPVSGGGGGGNTGIGTGGVNGIVNQVPVYSSANTIMPGIITDNGTNVGIGTLTSTSYAEISNIPVPANSTQFFDYPSNLTLKDTNDNLKAGLTIMKGTNSASASVTGMFEEVYSDNSGMFGGGLRAWSANTDFDGTGNLGSNKGIEIAVDSGINGNGGTVTNQWGISIETSIQNTTTATNLYGMEISVRDSLNATNTYGIYLDGMSNPNAYSIYSIDGMNYFGGNVGIGTVNPNFSLEVENGNVGIGTKSPLFHTSLSVFSDTGNAVSGRAPNGDGVWGEGDIGVEADTPGSNGRLCAIPPCFALELETASGDRAINEQGGGNSFFDDGLLIGTADQQSNTLNKLEIGNINQSSHPWDVFDTQGNLGLGTVNPTTILEIEQGNVGIGTPNAHQILEVNGTAKMTGFQLNKTPLAGGNILVSTSVGVGTWMPTSTLGFQASGSYLTGVIADSPLGGSGTSGSHLVISTAGTWSGNAGTATALAANGTNCTAGNYPLGVDASGNSESCTAVTSSQWATQNTKDVSLAGGNVGVGTIKTTTAALTVMNGNVGIGTWVPNGALDVGATGTICLGGTCNSSWPVGSSQWITNGGSNVGISTTQAVGIGTTFVGGTGEATLSVMNGNVGIGTWVPNGALDVGATGTICLGGTCNSSWPVGSSQWITNGGSNVGISTTQAVGIGTTFVGGTGEATLSVMNGNVGIGTWVPAKTLSVTGDTYLNGNIGIGTTFVGGTGEAALTVMNGNVGIGTWVPAALFQVGKNPIPILFSSTNGSVSVGTNSATNVLNVGSQSGFQVSDNGNIARIGGTPVTMSGAQYSFNVGTNAVIQNSSGTGGSAVILRGGASTSSFTTIQASSNANPGTEYINFLVGGTSSPVEVMRITAGGDVGIGTTLPSSILEVGNQKFNVLSGGNVGIGSITPGQLLDVKGAIRIANVGSTLAIVSGSNSCHGTATLSGGTVTVSTTCTPSVAQNIFLTDNGGGVLANIGSLYVGTVTGGTSFVINSSNALDSSNVGWVIIN